LCQRLKQHGAAGAHPRVVRKRGARGVIKSGSNAFAARPAPGRRGHALLKEEMNKKKNKTIRMYTGDNGGAAEEEISPDTRSFPGGSSTHISAPASEPKPLERSKSSQDAQKALERALASKGQFSFGSFGGYRVSPDAALLRVQAWRSFRERFGTTAFVPSMHYLTWSP
jgi:hypothetical protein